MKVAPWSEDAKRSGRFNRKQSEFRDAIKPEGPFTPDADRYHLYVQYACPWAHRTLLMRKLLGLEDAISVDVVSWRMQGDGSWVFEPEFDGATEDRLHDAASLQDVYHRAAPEFPGIGTVPVLWDKQTSTIVNNESREIIRMFDTVLGPTLGNGTSLLPEGLEADVDAMIDANYETINNGVYKCGFARTQEAYDEAWPALFGRLEELEEHMEGRDWLVGDGRGVLTEADICLWPTLLRFDPVYHTHFKCNRKLISQMPNLWAFVKRLHAVPGVAETVNMEHIRNHYYWSHTSLNPHRIVPVGPELDL
ncbi:MAG: glutathione S-transferase family protein [Thermoplasmatota archaeon]